jgi:hypothetical protein
MTKPLPQLRFQKRCWCGQPAVTVKTIRRYRTQGRLDGLFVETILTFLSGIDPIVS